MSGFALTIQPETGWAFTRLSLRVLFARLLSRLGIPAGHSAEQTVIEMMNNFTSGYELAHKIAPLLPDFEARRQKELLLSNYWWIETLGRMIPLLDDPEILLAFKRLKRSAYRLEALLHKAEYANAPVVPTPDYVKEAIAKLGMDSIANSNL